MKRLTEKLERLKQYYKNESGAIAIMFTIMVPVLIGIAGLSLDYSQAYLVKQRLEQALDAAALAGAASSTEEDVIRQRVLDFFAVNYPAEELGVSFVPTVEVVGDEVHVSGHVTYNTMFLKLLGIKTIEVEADTTVVREVQGIEVALVLDNTGSMSTNNNIGALRTAASNFVYIMYGIDVDAAATALPEDLDDMATRDRDFIKIGMVPYSTAVNVGPYGLGVDLNGDYYDEPFVNNPHNLIYSTSTSGSKWLGCVLAEEYPLDTTDNEGPWDMYRYCLDSNDKIYCDYKISKGKKTANNPPNYICPSTPLTPLVTSPSQLKTSINTMKANGHTYGNLGMVWGYRVLSPEYPFTEAEPWENQYWRKAVIMMTDGENTMHNKYSAYGPTQDHNLDAGDLNDRFLEVCDNMKEQGILIYTVTFYSGVPEATKEYYRQCATSEDYYYDAPDQEDLIDVFEKIGRELSNLHIKG